MHLLRSHGADLGGSGHPCLKGVRWPPWRAAALEREELGSGQRPLRAGGHGAEQADLKAAGHGEL